MNERIGTAGRIGLFAALLAVVFAAAAFAGSEIDPGVDDSESHAEEAGTDAHGASGGGEPAAGLPGLAVADAGFRLVVDQTELGAERASTLSFRIADPAGEPVTDFDVTHERAMHLILVRRDLAEFHHLHPRLSQDGTWSVAVPPLPPGPYRVFADFSSGGVATTLGADLFVPGDFHPDALAQATAVADAGDGYEVRIDGPTPSPGSTVPAEFSVTRGGRPVDGVEPYLGADGHLVALREGDLAFLHTHPEGEPGGTGPIRFGVEYPSAGRYRLFLQFKHGGEVRTAAFTQAAGDGAAVPAAPADAHDDEGSH